jgi:phosphoglycolate phosphatase-like HAD superfamily hydrolase
MNREVQTLIFDCDGVLGDAERDSHRIAFNHNFFPGQFSGQRIGGHIQLPSDTGDL